MGKLTFLSYENLVCAKDPYSDLNSEIFDTVSKVASTKTVTLLE